MKKLQHDKKRKETCGQARFFFVLELYNNIFFVRRNIENDR